MPVATDLIDRYVAVWNEPDRETRRRRIETVWAPGGATCHRLLDARGYEAIEARVAGSWERWLREGKYIFRAVRTASHHRAVKFEFAMVATAGGKIEAQGLCYLLLNENDRIARDYQFNPTIDEAADLAEKYLAPWNEADAGRQRDSLTALWAPDCAYFDAQMETRGLEQLAAKAAAVQHGLAARHQILAPAERSQRHHNVAHIGWRIAPADGGGNAAAGSTLLIMDEDGRAAAGYQFNAGAA
jgi:hypothetical protein